MIRRPPRSTLFPYTTLHAGDRGPGRAARKHHRLGARLGRDGGGGGGGATRAVARVHRLRRDRVRFHGAAGLPGAARVRVRAASVRGTAGVARPSAHGRVVSRLRARQGRPPVAGETAGALPAERAAPARRRPGDHRAPGRTRSTPGPAAARSGFARGLRTARRGERARIGRAPAPRLRPRRNPPRGRQSVKPRSATVRIAAGQGFWGDWLEGPYRQRIGVVTGDDLLGRLDGLLARGHELRNLDTNRRLADVRDRVVSANAYLGAWPVVDALRRGADVIVTGRVTDTGLTLAPMIHAFGWRPDAWDLLAAGTVAGHTIECGAQ